MTLQNKANISCAVLTGLGILVLFLLVLSPFLLRGLGAYLIVSDPLEVSQAVVSLSGDISRVEETVRYIREDYADWLILTETDEPSSNPEAPDTNSTMEKRKQALAEGVPEGDILVTQDKTDSTYDEAVAVRALMESHYLTSCIVVTDPFHARRTRMVFADVFRNSGIRVIVRPVSAHWYQPKTWYLSSKGWSTTLLEFTKLAAYRTGIRR